MAVGYTLSDFTKIMFESPDDDRYWFGYYNYCPLNCTQEKLLCHRWHSDGDERNFEQADTIDVGWFSLVDKCWHYVATTRAANWQQGAMSQWIVYDGEERIIFNDADECNYVSRIYNTDGTLYKTLPMAIYGITPDSSVSITINFERAYWCRTYHYEYIRDKSLNKNVTEVDGIYKMDLLTGESNKIIDIESIVKTDYRDEFANAKHWVEHIMLNPSGTKFAFYHRFDSGNGYKTRCFIADLSGKILCCLKKWEETSWSHLGWINDDEFVIFGVRRRPIGNAYSAITKNTGGFGRFLRKCYRALFAKHVSPQAHNKLAASSHYEIYNSDGEYKGCYEKGELVSDGHPSFVDKGCYMLTDTYADPSNKRNLLIYNTKKEKIYNVAKFESPINECGYRSDLHPRFGRDKKYVIVDSAHTGKHKILLLEINWNEMEK